MRKLLNTLFITSEDIYLTEDHGSVVLNQKGKKVGQFPLHILEDILLFSYSGASPMLMGKCAEMGIGLALLSPNGRFLCRVNGMSSGNVLLRKEQYRISDSEERALPYVKNMILGKVYNARWTLGRTVRDYPLRVNVEKINHSINLLNGYIDDIRNADSIIRLRGIEGNSAAEYFSVFDEMILNQKDDFYFSERNRRPPMDNVNALLSFCYTLLANECASALESVGIDAYVGFMHTDKPGRKSFALDLMEELRAPVVDRFVITLINQKQVKNKDFVKSEDGAVRFTDDARKNILSLWQEKKKTEITHPYLKEKIKWGLVPYVQALLISRTIRGDLDEYPPFLWK